MQACHSYNKRKVMINKFIFFIILFLSMTKNVYALGYWGGGNCSGHRYTTEEIFGDTRGNLEVFLIGIVFPGILLLISIILMKIDEKKKKP